MKKIVLSSITSVMIATSANAFMGINAEVGAGMWSPSLSGHVQYGSSTNEQLDFGDLGVDSDSSNSYLYADFSHFVPLIPNVRVEKLSYELKGDSTLTTTPTFGNLTLTANTKVTTAVNMEQTDMIAYWGVPLLGTATAGVLNVNFGLDLKTLSGDISLTQGGTSEMVKFDETLPLVYLNARVDIPFAPIKLEATTKTISYDGASIADSEAKVSFALPIPTPLITISADLGYRTQSITIPDSLVDDLDAKIDTSGMFFGVNARF